MDESGYIKIFRKILYWTWYKHVPTRLVFLHLLITANWKDKKWKGRIIKRGQVITGRKGLAKHTGLTEQQVRTAIENLKSTNEITIQSTKTYSLVTLMNYDLYQNVKPKSTNGATTTKEIYKEKELPTLEEFMIYAKSKCKNNYWEKRDNLILKYESWVMNNWRDGYNKPIKNWKLKVINALQYVKREYKRQVPRL